MDTAPNFVELHKQVQTSMGLLDSLANFLSTFQKDLSAVSGQISDLQLLSKDIEDRLQRRKRIEKSLSSLVTEISITPEVATMILDSPVGESWIGIVAEFEKCLRSLDPRSKLKAVKDISTMAEGLRIVATTKLRSFFLSLLAPLRSSMSTNLPVLQSTVLVKYRPLFGFLQRYDPQVAMEIQSAYVATTRTYYETGFRRYIRSLKVIHSRAVDKDELIVTPEKSTEHKTDISQLSHQTSIHSAGVTLAYLADMKSHTEPTPSLFRSTMMVLMDNATVEYAFLHRFFLPEIPRGNVSGEDFGITYQFQEDALSQTQSRLQHGMQITTTTSNHSGESSRTIDNIWKAIFEPSLEHCQGFIETIISASPPIISVLTLTKLNDAVLRECQARHCFPLENFILSIRLLFWPVFQKQMNAHVDSLKRLADSANGGILSKGTIRDSLIQTIVIRYGDWFAAMISLSDEEEGIIFSNLMRLRDEIFRLIESQSRKIKNAKQSAAYRMALFDMLLRFLAEDGIWHTHPQTQIEIARWRAKKEEARRCVNSSQ